MTESNTPAAQEAPRWTEYMPVSNTESARNNPKGHDTTRIRGSIERFGFVDQAILDERTGRLVGGHGRLEQLREMRDAGENPPDGIVVDDSGEWLWPVTRGWSSRSDAEADALLVALNRLTELGGWDDLGGLADILSAAHEADAALLDIAGYSTSELDTLLELTNAHTTTLGTDDDDDEDTLARTDKGAWPRISVQVPPDVFDRWRAVPGDDDADRVMLLLRLYEAQADAADDDEDG